MSTQPQAQHNRRRRYFIDKRIQSRMIGLTVLFTVLFASFAVALVKVNSGGGDNLMIIAITGIALVLTLFIIYYGLRFTHRIVGPIYAFNRHIAQVRDGRYKNDLRLRKDDEFQNLAISFNTMLSRLRERSEQGVELCDQLNAELDKLEGIDAATLSKIKQQIEQFKKQQETLLQS
ncbi:MAG: HAMP domain-containing protein [Candidatus Alcyoniella australis]|nr:HAMP domain-containing protein [Candidatus Alcyoniella australis]